VILRFILFLFLFFFHFIWFLTWKCGHAMLWLWCDREGGWDRKSLQEFYLIYLPSVQDGKDMIKEMQKKFIILTVVSVPTFHQFIKKYFYCWCLASSDSRK
jgi:hypothetical protein